MNVAKFFDFSKLTRRGSGGTSRSQFYYDSTEVSPVATECDTRHVTLVSNYRSCFVIALEWSWADENVSRHFRCFDILT